MIRLKLAGILFALFGALGIFVYAEVSHRLEAVAVEQVDVNLNQARQVVTMRRALQDHAILERAELIAKTPKIIELLSETYTAQKLGKEGAEEGAEAVDPAKAGEDFAYKIHQLVWEEVYVWNERLKAGKGADEKSRSLQQWRRGAPNFLAVVDKQGFGVAEAKRKASYGQAAAFGKAHPALMRSMKNNIGQKDLWTFRGNAMATGMAPIRAADGRVLGAVVLGYNLTVTTAKSAQPLAKAHVAFYVGGRVEGRSSLPARLEAGFGARLKTEINAAKTDRGLFDVDLEGKTFRAYWSRMQGYAEGKAAVAVLENKSGAIRAAQRGLFVVPFAIALVMILAVFGVILVFSRYDVQFRSLDKGVLEIINGGLDYWFQVSGTGVPSTMAQNLNIMVCQLSGRPLPEEDDQIQAQNWVRDKLFVDAINTDELAEQEPLHASVMDTGQMATMSEDMVALVRDDDEAYRSKVFAKYMAALKQSGQSVAGITESAFLEQHDAHAAQLRTQLNCERIRFLVEVENGKATLKPVPLD
jgi:hypothetical protein